MQIPWINQKLSIETIIFFEDFFLIFGRRETNLTKGLKISKNPENQVKWSNFEAIFLENEEYVFLRNWVLRFSMCPIDWQRNFSKFLKELKFRFSFRYSDSFKKNFSFGGRLHWMTVYYCVQNSHISDRCHVYKLGISTHKLYYISIY